MLAKPARTTTSIDNECKSLLEAARQGKRIFIHCRGGLGRTGTLAGRLLIENGLEPEAAINEVREARKGAIETALQEYYLLYKAWENQE